MEAQREYSASKITTGLVFENEIGCMMHSYGDISRPLKSSVALVERILRDQMNLLLKKASKLNENQKEKYLTHGHLLVLLRKNKDKLTRLMKYLKVKDDFDFLSKKKHAEMSGVVKGCAHGPRIKACLKFLRKVEGKSFRLDTILSDDDPVNFERTKRRYFMANYMDDEEYTDFVAKQSATFNAKKYDNKFKRWLLAEKATKFVPSNLAIQIINYLARETVAEIVEAALLLKRDRHPDWYHNLNDIYKPHSENSTTEETSEDSVFKPKIPPCQPNDPITPENINNALGRLYMKSRKNGQVEWKRTKPRLLCV
ncbi:transcription initiation protein SPT3-like protein [Nephila pilipes]|uniref:Transcription initiation protein SPT3-like protein n=1 Tax=Nephila pilipes TaxID=299642 RepID=A0A8X6QNC4_NEPPI|nr:transcription initiation protein SPT3-like protein [Nephila pilipes]